MAVLCNLLSKWGRGGCNRDLGSALNNLVGW